VCLQPNQQPDSAQELNPRAEAYSAPTAWPPLLAILTYLQQHEQLLAARLLLSAYRPLTFIAQQGLYLIMPLGLLLGISPSHFAGVAAGTPTARDPDSSNALGGMSAEVLE